MRLPPPPKISVVVPVYNEHDNIVTCLRRLHAALTDVPHEILVCYDFDEDSTLPAIAAMSDRPPTLRLVKNTIGRGAANALRAGFAAASGDVVVTSMADLSDTPETIPRMAALMRARDLAVVAGSRYVDGGSQTGGPLLKRTFSRIAGVSLDWIAGVGTRDATTNFRAYSKAFLDSVTIESTTGFEIALELTVKAHLEGRGVGEVPASWTDRSAGQSRFRMWKWMPNYLRWWMRAAWQPLLVWIAFLASFAYAFTHARASGLGSGLGEALVTVFAALGAGAILLAQRARGRSLAIDALHALAWTHAWHAQLAEAGKLHLDAACTLGASALLLLITPGYARLRPFVARCARRAFDGFTQRNVGLALLVLVLWPTRLWSIEYTAANDLDASWQQVLGWALKNNVQFGPDIAFTFGPLGYFARGTYDPDLYWWHFLWWNVAFKLVLCAWLVSGVARLRGRPLEAFFYGAGSILIVGGFDTLFFASLLAIATWMIANPAGKPVRTLIGVVAMWTIGLVKFTSLTLAGISLVIVALNLWRARSRGDALRFACLAAVVPIVVWTLLGQRPWNLPLYILRGLQLSSGYNEAMACVLSEPVQTAGLWTLAAFAACIALYLSSRLRQRTAWASAALVSLTVAAAFKASFTMQSLWCLTFFSVTAVAPYLLWSDPASSTPTASARIRDGLALVLKFACTGVAIVIIAFWRGNGTPQYGDHARFLLQEASTNVSDLVDWRRTRLDLDRVRERMLELRGLPQLRARVGRDTVDIWPSEQGIVLLNDFNYRPRPIFQGYAAYTPALLAANAEFLRSDRAPRYVVFDLGAINGRMPTMEDGAAFLALSRDYRPVTSEQQYLLLERKPRGPVSEPKVLLERTVRPDEKLDLSSFDRPLLLALDVQYELEGRVVSALLRAPQCRLLVEQRSGYVADLRIIPGMMRTGVLLDPLLGGWEDAVSWFGGLAHSNVKSITVKFPDGLDCGFSTEIGVRILDAGEFVPERNEDVLKELELSMMVPKPVEVVTAFPKGRVVFERQPGVLVHAPSLLRFELPPGAHELRASFGIAPDAWNGTFPGHTDGVRFVVSERDAGGGERVVWERFLDPFGVEADRGVQQMTLSIGAAQSRTVLLRTRVGPAGDSSFDWAVWTSVVFQRATER